MDTRLSEWGMISSGEGGNSVASLFLATRRHEAIGDRVVLFNTARADISKTEDLVKHLMNDVKDKLDKNAVEKIENLTDYVQMLAETGAGNLWMIGENVIKQDFESSELVRRKIESLGFSASDVICDVFALGGGTGCGSIPYLVHKTKKEGVTKGKHIALSIWPESDEGVQRHFNAICGFSRLLRYNGTQNADLVILVGNDSLAEKLNVKGRQDKEAYFQMNNIIADVMELVIAPGRAKSDVTIDVPDYVNWPSLLKVTHVVPCISMGNDTEIIGLETALDDALKNPLFSCNPKSASMVWAVFRVPSKADGDFDVHNIRNVFNNWVDQNLVGEVKYVAVTFDEAKKDEFDVLLLLGGCDINIDKSLKSYETCKRAIAVGGDIQDIDGQQVSIPTNVLDDIDKNLENYLEHVKKVREMLEGGEI